MHWKTFYLSALLGLVSLGHASAFSTVVLDAGHGGSDRGGIPGQRIPEKTMTLDVALRIKPILEVAGMKVLMTRSRDEFVSLRDRCLLANRTRNSIFVSVHFDSYYRRGADGVTTYYSNFQSRRLAEIIHRNNINALRPQTDRGIKRARFYVLRNTVSKAVLIEGGYLTNPWESSRIATPGYRQRLAESIANAILSFKKTL